MSVVTIAEAWPAAGRPFTVAELDRMPDDGRRYELLDGTLVVSPRPTTIHQFVAMRLLRALADACPEDLCVVPEPAVEHGQRQRYYQQARPGCHQEHQADGEDNGAHNTDRDPAQQPDRVLHLANHAQPSPSATAGRRARTRIKGANCW